jgi:hypothetical protein
MGSLRQYVSGFLPLGRGQWTDTGGGLTVMVLCATHVPGLPVPVLQGVTDDLSREFANIFIPTVPHTTGANACHP